MTTATINFTGYAFANKKVKAASWISLVDNKFVSILEEIEEMEQNVIAYTNGTDPISIGELREWIEDAKQKFNANIKTYSNLLTVSVA